jgi:hypothetical protein
MGGRGEGAAGGRGRTGGAAERLTKAQKDEEKRQIDWARERDNKNRSNAETFVRNAAQDALDAAKGERSKWEGFSLSEIGTLAQRVFSEGKKLEKATGGVSQASANKLVSDALKIQMSRYSKSESVMQEKMRTSYTKGGFARPKTDFQRREMDRIIALAADNAMGRIYSTQGASAKLRTGAVTPTFLKKGLQQAMETLGTSLK